MTTVPYRPGPCDVETVSGRYLDLMAPNPDAISLSDVAWHLATTNRYCGAARRPMSVAEHALLVAEYLAERGRSPVTVLGGLHHDDHEAYMGDINAGVKNYLAAHAWDAGGASALELLARRLDAAIAVALELPPLNPAQASFVKDADMWALAAEAWHLMPSRGAGWSVDGRYDPLFDDPDLSHPRLGLRRLSLAGAPSHHAIAAEWVATHQRWMRLHETQTIPREEQTR